MNDNYFSFNYDPGSGNCKGFFKILQGKGGAIYLQMAFNTILLTKDQVEKLPIDIYKLEDFDHDLYLKHYNQ